MLEQLKQQQTLLLAREALLKRELESVSKALGEIGAALQLAEALAQAPAVEPAVAEGQPAE